MISYDRAALLEALDAHGGNDAKTKLTEVEWGQLATKKRGAWVVVIDGKAIAEGPWLKMLGYFLINTHAGDRVKMLGHTDFVMRLLTKTAPVAK